MSNLINEDFKNKISFDLPTLWQDFFEDIKRKNNSIKFCEDLIVFKLKDDKNLLDLIVKDTVIKDLIYKAEGYHIVIQKDNVKTLLKRLESFGYYND